jgi:hypothetical protein
MFLAKIVECANDPFGVIACVMTNKVGISRIPVLHMRGKLMKEIFDHTPLVHGVVEPFIAEEVLRTVGAALDPIRPVMEFQVMCSNIFESSPL